jgi:hypothetical protein
MSFLIDPPWLYANGRVIGARAPRHAGKLAALTTAAFYAVSVPLYLDHSWTRPVWRACRAASGRDWMLNSGILRLEHRRPRPRTHAVSALIFATYPLWLWLGIKHGSRS